MNVESAVNTARPGTRSLRTTIPEGVVFYLDLNDGDKVQWEKITVGDDTLAVIVRKINKK